MKAPAHPPRPGSPLPGDEDAVDYAATHLDRKKCVCGGRRSLKRRPWSSISLTTDGPKWVYLWRCPCGSEAFDHAESG